MKSRAAVLWIFVTLVGLTVVAQQPAQNNPVPQLISYSGVARDISGKALSGTVGITFLLYQQEQGGAPLWLETQNVQADARGNYSAQLGATLTNGIPSDLFVSGEARWLAVQISGQSEGARVMLLSVPYAMKAGDAATVGGLPPSAFLLAAPGAANTASGPAAPASFSSSFPSSSNVTTTGGTVNTIPLFTTATNIQNSALTQTGTGATAKVGVGTTTPTSTLDVKGGGTIRGMFSLPATGTATSTGGKISQPIDLVASAFNSSSNAAVNQTFQWQAEPAGNDTANPSGTLNLLYGLGATKPSETGLHIASNGQINFAAGQTFPGTGNGTITGVTAGTGVTGGGSTGNVTLNVDPTQVPYLNAANTFNGNQTVNGNITSVGFVYATLVDSLDGFSMGGVSFDYGSFANHNAFLGFSGNTGITGVGNTSAGVFALHGNTTGGQNTATGYATLYNNTTGSTNTANGFDALSGNTTGSNNTASGYAALGLNTTGNGNTASGALALDGNSIGSYNTADGNEALWMNTTGYFNTASGTYALNTNSSGISNTGVGAYALENNTTGGSNSSLGMSSGTTVDKSNITGSNNTFLGANSAASTGTLTNATAIGANAEVGASNAMVLGSINGVNGATASTNVGIGTTSPAATLDVHGTGNFTGLITFGSGQTFPGTGTVSSVGSGAGLTGGPITGSGSLSIATGGVSNAMLANSSLTINTGTGLLGGAPVSLGGSTTLNIDTTKVPLLAASNTFIGSQTVTGNLSATGVVTGNSFQIGSNLFGFGSFLSGNAFLGFAGNATMTAGSDTATGAFALALNTTGNNSLADGSYALYANTEGNDNTASGFGALFNNTMGGANTGVGISALSTNLTGNGNTGVGAEAGETTDFTYLTGSNNTFLGANAFASTGTLTNATAIGGFSEVTANNAMVLGSINGVNTANASTKVGIGITAPTYLLHIGNQGGTTYNNFFRVEGPTTSGTNGLAASFGGYGAFEIDAAGKAGGRFIVTETGRVGIGAQNPIVSDSLTIGQGTGHAIADGWDTYSSRRWKENIQTLHGALAKVEQLRGVSYDLKETGKHEVGVIAEEVGAVVPEVVSWEKNGKDAYGVDYSRLTALLIEATKEQQALIREQQKQIKAQKAQIARLASQVTAIQTLLTTNGQTSSEVRRVRTRAKLLPMRGVQ